jgi:hypothetical protein
MNGLPTAGLRHPRDDDARGVPGSIRIQGIQSQRNNSTPRGGASTHYKEYQQAVMYVYLYLMLLTNLQGW